MGKDRYSDDHTIEVAGETKTVTIKDNLEVESDITLGGDIVSSSGTITINAVSCDSLTTNEIDATDLVITANSVEIDSADITFSSAPLLSANEIRYKSYQASKFIANDMEVYHPTTLNNEYYYWDESGSEARIFCGITDIPDGATILSCTVAFEPGHIDDEITVLLAKHEISTGNSSGPSAQMISILAGDVGAYKNKSLAFAYNIDYENYFHSIYITLKCGSGSSVINFFGVRMAYQTKSVGL